MNRRKTNRREERANGGDGWFGKRVKEWRDLLTQNTKDCPKKQPSKNQIKKRHHKGMKHWEKQDDMQEINTKNRYHDGASFDTKKSNPEVCERGERVVASLHSVRL
jgi:hypothetical protein